MAKLEKVAIGIDLGERSLRIARWTAERLAPGAELLLVYVVETPPLSIFYRGVLPPREKMVEAALEPAKVKLAELAAELGDSRAKTDLRVGRPAECIAAAAHDANADLIVIGRHGRHHSWGELGSTAEELFHFATTPVLLPDDLPTDVGVILMPIEDGKLAPRVIEWARFLSEKYGSKIVALHVLSQMLRGHLRLISTTKTTERAEASAREAAETWVAEALAAAGLDMSQTVIEIAVGHTDQEILEAKERHNADAIVMGSHGPGELERAVMGSCASTVTRHARCPVLVVLAGEEG
ncbi:MAG: universal stress protein [Gemmatimonadota bacterium]